MLFIIPFNFPQMEQRKAKTVRANLKLAIFPFKLVNKNKLFYFITTALYKSSKWSADF